ncbi:hypothetical protein D6851_09195 [Altericroceibacterium spongiae]|uniref:Uncharacterized protein n=1 Tax=Altericroceibacterium spongiae TaxID=2320269 RepID=A0A420EKC4_9SPHN|nr:hypothetical protein [Altericroceibacterium spongiae]RKF21100.1 hypothetical protein D6851_09195 [Altericroceibacterium spongiae]
MADPAKGRFFIIALVRLAGIGMILLALMIYYKEIAAPEIVAGVLAILGLLTMFGGTRYLARKWRSGGSCCE